METGVSDYDEAYFTFISIVNYIKDHCTVEPL